MHRVLGFACTSVLLLAACSDGTSESLGKVSAAFIDGNASGPPSYNGGLVETSPTIVVVYWGPNVSTLMRNNMPFFYQTMSNNRYMDVADEYSTSSQIIGRGSLGPVVTITPTHTSTSLFDADIKAELSTQITRGVLPLSDSTNTIYAIHFPPTTSIFNPALGQQCHDWCAYHAQASVHFSFGDVNVAYTVVPDQAPGSNCENCYGLNVPTLDTTTAGASHEIMEATTDPFPNSGWSPEIGDGSGCHTFSTIYAANRASYKVQPMSSLLTGGCVSAPPATVGVFRPGSSAGDEWLLHTSNTHGDPQFDFFYGMTGDQPVVGNWFNSNELTIGIYRPSTNEWWLRNSNTGGPPDITVFPYGGTGDLPVTGDWDGNGTTTVGVYRPAPNSQSQSYWLLHNSNAAGQPELQFPYGGLGDVPVVGDWDGDGITTIGVYRPPFSPSNPTNEAHWLLRNSNSQGQPDILEFGYGASGDLPVVGDWDGDGKTTIGVYRPPHTTYNDSDEGQWLLRNSNNGGGQDIPVFTYGGAGDVPVVGPWRRHN
jgi:hypothetical protein